MVKQSVSEGTQSKQEPRLANELIVVETSKDEEWDEFLANQPYGYHVQSSLWARVKEALGWSPLRVIARDQAGTLVGGAQILVRQGPGPIKLGYLTKGPVFSQNDPGLQSWFIEELKGVARNHSLKLLTVQPPDDGTQLSPLLEESNFARSPIQISLTSTVQIDLSQDIDTILANMKPKTRYNIRLAARKNVTVREGSAEDLPVFHTLLTKTSDRQNYQEYALDYFERMSEIFGDHMKLFMAEYNGEAVSGLLAIAFGNRVHFKKGAWSGRHGERRPNELMHWEAIQWAKAHGYRYYDFDGIDREVADALITTGLLPAGKTNSVSRFKIGFGGEVVLLPSTSVWTSTTLLRAVYCKIYPRVSAWKPVKHLYNALRWR